MMCDARLWEAQIRQMNQPVLVADTTSADNFSDMAAEVLASAPRTFGMAGLSMGGILAFEIWRQAPERVTHLALIDTNPHPDSDQRRSLRLQQIEQARAGRLKELAIESLKPMYLAPANRHKQEMLDTILEMALSLGPEVFRKQSLALRERVDSVPTLSGIDCPTTVMCGREDTLCPVEYHELMARKIPNAQLVIIDDCGHLAPMEQPAIVSAELRRLFQS